MSLPPPEPLVPVPDQGRIFSRQRPVRLGDVDTGGRLRLDAAARFLQDIANDDATSGGLPGALNWLVRKSIIEVHQPAVFQEDLTLRTFCSGIGGRWAERRTSVRGNHGAHLEAAALWVFFDPDSGKPQRLSPDFHDIYGATAAGRKVSARLTQPEPEAVGSPDTHQVETWPLRQADHDFLGHVNNAVYWVVIEQLLAELDVAPDAPMRGEVEYRLPIEPGDTVLRTVAAPVDGAHLQWLVADGETRASLSLRLA